VWSTNSALYDSYMSCLTHTHTKKKKKKKKRKEKKKGENVKKKENVRPPKLSPILQLCLQTLKSDINAPYTTIDC
jgi:hypothetical protein